MNLEDILIAPKEIKSEAWQLGSTISTEIREGGIVLVFCSDYRGVRNGKAEIQDYKRVREQLYHLSKLDFEIPIADLGDLISGKGHEDTHFILQEIISLCLSKNAIPIIVGGGNDLAFALFSAINFHHQNINYTQISNLINLDNSGDTITEKNFLSKILSSKNFTIKNYHHLGYQKHLNEVDSVRLMRQVDFEVIRLAEMMNNTEKTEPFFRFADLITVNCDAIESRTGAFSVNPQVNGLNNREICAYMKEIGLSRNLKSAGIFNYNAESENFMNHQLLAQMIWHLVEGINIQRTHPAERSYETFWVMTEDTKYAFQRDVFSDLWFFGDDEKEENWIPCSFSDYEAAKRGLVNPRFLK
ncbi:formimidoylglutamase [Chryseobacterium sp. SNU WT5]|uniref:formimidoylglutamase n=1 Tax=Chryseobacterium sp. SNU WT5 TaxID=2594269 RepID=UPI00117C4840|nr:formimidoylglutamase [Chryseobacterium sp. SNU WT5]QDP85026.1 formimidoylglutamase [Chryseobacterium sp. SNU WT5]